MLGIQRLAAARHDENYAPSIRPFDFGVNLQNVVVLVQRDDLIVHKNGKWRGYLRGCSLPIVGVIHELPRQSAIHFCATTRTTSFNASCNFDASLPPACASEGLPPPPPPMSGADAETIFRASKPRSIKSGVTATIMFGLPLISAPTATTPEPILFLK